MKMSRLLFGDYLPCRPPRIEIERKPYFVDQLTGEPIQERVGILNNKRIYGSFMTEENCSRWLASYLRSRPSSDITPACDKEIRQIQQLLQEHQMKSEKAETAKKEAVVVVEGGKEKKPKESRYVDNANNSHNNNHVYSDFMSEGQVKDIEPEKSYSYKVTAFPHYDMYFIEADVPGKKALKEIATALGHPAPNKVIACRTLEDTQDPKHLIWNRKERAKMTPAHPPVVPEEAPKAAAEEKTKKRKKDAVVSAAEPVKAAAADVEKPKKEKKPRKPREKKPKKKAEDAAEDASPDNNIDHLLANNMDAVSASIINLIAKPISVSHPTEPSLTIVPPHDNDGTGPIKRPDFLSNGAKSPLLIPRVNNKVK
jgi:hypothetical protein